MQLKSLASSLWGQVIVLQLCIVRLGGVGTVRRKTSGQIHVKSRSVKVMHEDILEIGVILEMKRRNELKVLLSPPRPWRSCAVTWRAVWLEISPNDLNYCLFVGESFCCRSENTATKRMYICLQITCTANEGNLLTCEIVSLSNNGLITQRPPGTASMSSARGCARGRFFIRIHYISCTKKTLRPPKKHNQQCTQQNIHAFPFLALKDGFWKGANKRCAVCCNLTRGNSCVWATLTNPGPLQGTWMRLGPWPGRVVFSLGANKRKKMLKSSFIQCTPATYT